MSKNNKPARRSGEAVAAQHRRAGYMHDRRAPRGGTKNLQAEYLALADDAEDEYLDWDY